MRICIINCKRDRLGRCVLESSVLTNLINEAYESGFSDGIDEAQSTFPAIDLSVNKPLRRNKKDGGNNRG